MSASEIVESCPFIFVTKETFTEELAGRFMESFDDPEAVNGVLEATSEELLKFVLEVAPVIYPDGEVRLTALDNAVSLRNLPEFSNNPILDREEELRAFASEHDQEIRRFLEGVGFVYSYEAARMELASRGLI